MFPRGEKKHMRSRFIACCMSLCFACMMQLQVSSMFLFSHTAYAVATKVYTFQVIRTSKNSSSNTQHLVVQSVQINYQESPTLGTNTLIPAVGCVNTPDDNAHDFKSKKSFAFGSIVTFSEYKSTDCKNDITQTVYSGIGVAFIPSKGQVTSSTCLENLDTHPYIRLSKCNGS